MFLYFKFLERDGNRGPRPASVILIRLDGLDWITPAVWWQHRPQWFHVWRGAGYLAGYARYIIFGNKTFYLFFDDPLCRIRSVL